MARHTRCSSWRTGFYGKQASKVSFTSFSPLVAGLAKIEYSVEEDDGKLVLKKRIGSAFTKTGEPKSIELMEDYRVIYRGARYGDKWVKTWTALNPAACLKR